MIIKDKVNDLRGAVHLDIYKNGQLIETDDNHNLIVTSGRTMLAKLLGGGANTYITQVGVGTSNTAAANTDTKLTNCVKIAITSTTYDEAKVRFNFTLDSSTANGLNIYEFGLFFADGTLFSRRVRNSVIGKESDIQISGYWEIYL